MASVEVKHNPDKIIGSDLVERFNALQNQYEHVFWEKENREPIKKQMESILSSFPSKEEKDAFLWESIRKRIFDDSCKALAILEFPETQRMYEYVGSLTPESLVVKAKEDPNSVSSIQLNRNLSTLFNSVELDIYDPEPEGQYQGVFPYFPYKGLRMLDNLDLTRICANLGHDRHSIPALSNFSANLGHHLQYLIKEDQKLAMTFGDFAIRVAPHLHEGAIWMFEAFRDMAANTFPLKSANLSHVADVVIDEAAVRAFGDNTVKNFLYQGVTYENFLPNEKDSKQFDHFTITTHIEPNLVLPGNEAGLHLLLYQFVKNSVQILKTPVYNVKDPHVYLDVKECNVDDTPIYAIRFKDNGPGLDFTSILRVKQQLLQRNAESLNALEKRIVNDWMSLDLRLIDLTNFIFERRISGSARFGSQHSGIGMALAKELVESHGGCIWATNNSGEQGAKFLILLDPSGNGNLRRQIPELFQTETIPSDILSSIDDQLSAETN